MRELVEDLEQSDEEDEERRWAFRQLVVTARRLPVISSDRTCEWAPVERSRFKPMVAMVTKDIKLMQEYAEESERSADEDEELGLKIKKVLMVVDRMRNVWHRWSQRWMEERTFLDKDYDERGPMAKP